MKEWLQKYWKWLVLAVIVIVVSVVVYYAIYNAGKKSGTSAAIATIPNPDNAAPLSDAERAEIGSLTKRLEDMMSGFLWSVFWGNDYSAITDLATAPSRIQIGVYGQYLQDRPNTNLIIDISSLKSLNYDFDQIRNNLITQLQNNLKQ